MKKTGWFSGDQKPVRRGVYQRKHLNGEVYYSLWDGMFWRLPNPDIVAAGGSKIVSCFQAFPWRGLAQGESK